MDKLTYKPEQKYCWRYECPCGCGNKRPDSGTIEEYIVKKRAAIAGAVLRRKPKTSIKAFMFNLN